MQKADGMSEVLKKAREYEANALREGNMAEKPEFHVCPPVGWMNDPNGFSEYQDEYHLCYQYYPYGSAWGPMHWGHAKTKDFIKWEQLPAALAPDTEYDGQGCFSGSAIEKDGRHLLFYTGVMDKSEEMGKHIIRQNQCLAIGNGINYKKADCNPVISAEALPEGSSREDFRDPKVWMEGEKLYMVVGSRAADGSGQIPLFCSKDGQKWELLAVLDQSRNELGRMWECPDFFSLNGKQILLVSPQEMTGDEEFHNGNNTVFLIGTYESRNCAFEREKVQAADYGLDFYAPQTLETRDGRRIMIGWLQSWDNHMYPEGFEWSGIMSIPRELEYKNGRVYQKPIREIRNYYTDAVIYSRINIQGSKKFPDLKGRIFDLEVEVLDGEYHNFFMKFAQNEKFESIIRYRVDDNTLKISRENSGLTRDVIVSRKIKLGSGDSNLKLRIIADKYSVEIFVNDGFKVLSMLYFTELSADGIEFLADGRCIVNIKKHGIGVR